MAGQSPQPLADPGGDSSPEENARLFNAWSDAWALAWDASLSDEQLESQARMSRPEDTALTATLAWEMAERKRKLEVNRSARFIFEMHEAKRREGNRR
jgi:hypothetical protein